MKLCIDCRLMGNHGLGTYLKGLLKELANDKRFTLSLLYYPKDIELLPGDSEKIPMKSPIYSLAEQGEWVKKIPICDLFFSPHFNVPLLPIRAKKRMTVFHDVFHLAHFKTLSFLQKFYAKIMYNGAVFLSDQVLTVSDFSKKEIEKYLTIRPKKLRAIYNGIDSQKSPIKLKYSLPDSFILAINGKPHKNLSALFNAYSGDIVVVGKKGETMRKEIHYLGDVTDEEMLSLYERAAVFVFPSLYEGFGYPPLEAMSRGCPVVVSNKASLPEICGNAAEFVDPTDLSSLSEGIYKVLNDKERKKDLIKKGFEQVKKYDLQKQMKELRDLIYESGCCS